MKAIAFLVTASAAWFAAAPSPTSPPLPQDWNVASVHSSVQFKIKHANATWFYGAFKQVSGKFTLDDNPDNSKVEVKIAADSVETYDDKRNQHVKGPDFLDAKQYPDITFTSTKIKRSGDVSTIDGELSMRGQKKAITVKATKTGEGNFMGAAVLGYETTFTIQRSDFGMKYGLAEKALGDDITMTISLELMQPKK